MNKKLEYLNKVSKVKKHKFTIISDTEAIHDRLASNIESYNSKARELNSIREEMIDLGEEVRQDWDGFIGNLETLRQEADRIGIDVDELGLDYVTSRGERMEYNVGLIREISVGLFNINGLHDFK